MVFNECVCVCVCVCVFVCVCVCVCEREREREREKERERDFACSGTFDHVETFFVATIMAEGRCYWDLMCVCVCVCVCAVAQLCPTL